MRQIPMKSFTNYACETHRDKLKFAVIVVIFFQNSEVKPPDPLQQGVSFEFSLNIFIEFAELSELRSYLKL